MPNDLDDKNWQICLEACKQKYNTLFSVLRIARPVLTNGQLELTFDFAFHQKRINLPENKQKINEIFTSTLGYPVRVSNVFVKPKSQSVEPSANISSAEASSAAVVTTETPKLKIDRIYLERVHIANFRRLTDTEVKLQPFLNVIVGENNIGKTAFIDAIRLALQAGRYKKGVYVSREDFQNELQDIEIDLYFHCPKGLKGFHELKVLDKTTNTTYLALHVRYTLAGLAPAKQVRQSYWGGNNENHKLDEDVLDSLNFEYLGALRDAKAMLRPSSKGKIAELLINLRTTPEARKKIEDIFKRAQNDPEIKALVTEAVESIQSHLSKIALKKDDFKVNLSPLPPDFEELVGSFEMKLLKEVLVHSVSQNGLGYNNILYASTVLGHIKKVHEIDPERYHALIIEEPEAHLHPQLEDSLFSYLSELGSSVGSQIITTTHSSIISSTTSIKNLTMFIAGDNNVDAIELASMPLSKKEERKISRYLDVTKSRLFFAKGIIFVEGITEALLIPKLADAHFNEANSLTSRGIEVVSVNGVSFEPYAKLFNDSEKYIPLQAVILTDKDSYTDKKGTYHEMSPRAVKALGFKKNHLSVEVSEKITFECDLWHAGNDAAMKQAGENLFARSTIDTPETLLDKMAKSKTIGKGEFAQELLDVVEDDDVALKVPEYIQKALNWVDGDATN